MGFVVINHLTFDTDNGDLDYAILNDSDKNRRGGRESSYGELHFRHADRTFDKSESAEERTNLA